jgi:hypothetical protein
MAYRQPAVNGELVETVIRTSSGPILLAGSKLFFRRFAADLAALVGSVEEPLLPKPAGRGRPPLLKTGAKRYRCTPARLAAIMAVADEVEAGRLSHKAAAASLALTRSGFTSWLHRLDEARRLGRPIVAVG